MSKFKLLLSFVQELGKTKYSSNGRFPAKFFFVGIINILLAVWRFEPGTPRWDSQMLLFAISLYYFALYTLGIV